MKKRDPTAERAKFRAELRLGDLSMPLEDALATTAQQRRAHAAVKSIEGADPDEVRRLEMLASIDEEAARDIIRRRALAAERERRAAAAQEFGARGAEFGHKGGRGSAKPPVAHLVHWYADLYLPTIAEERQSNGETGGHEAVARAALADDLAEIYGVSEQAARGWLRGAKI